MLTGVKRQVLSSEGAQPEPLDEFASVNKLLSDGKGDFAEIFINSGILEKIGGLELKELAKFKDEKLAYLQDAFNWEMQVKKGEKKENYSLKSSLGAVAFHLSRISPTDRKELSRVLGMLKPLCGLFEDNLIELSSNEDFIDYREFLREELVYFKLKKAEESLVKLRSSMCYCPPEEIDSIYLKYSEIVDLGKVTLETLNKLLSQNFGAAVKPAIEWEISVKKELRPEKYSLKHALGYFAWRLKACDPKDFNRIAKLANSIFEQIPLFAEELRELAKQEEFKEYDFILKDMATHFAK